EDFDNRMVSHFVQEFKAKHNKDIIGRSKSSWEIEAQRARQQRAKDDSLFFDLSLIPCMK
ncbi:OLC1v1035820C1, partial [Oldenlandia corymbosa var. corymbosa]